MPDQRHLQSPLLCGRNLVQYAASEVHTAYSALPHADLLLVMLVVKTCMLSRKRFTTNQEETNLQNLLVSVVHGRHQLCPLTLD